MLEVRGLTVEYGKLRAVDAVDLTVPEGALLGLVGESGCGKSTLVRAVMGVLAPGARMRGEVLVGGAPVRRERLWRDLAFVPQTAMNALDPVYRLREQMREVLCGRGGLAREAADRRAAELFRDVGLDPARLADFPHQFSGGMRQRAGIALALALHPRLLLLDEPVTALDVIVQRQVLDTLRDLAAAQRLSAVVVTHDISVVAYLCDAVAVMYAGRIVECGPARDVLTRPAHPYTMGLMNAFPDLQGATGALTCIEGAPPDLLHPPPGCRFAPRCPFALPACTEADPAMLATGPGHAAACIRAGEAEGLRARAREAEAWAA
ncbi:MAG TPA: ABC transporter ATP-binding protein [Acetobacteraceae bacterium]|nr:ABC transporter ATP-binding protein [Acetobacteraceae bacterium]